MRPPLSRYIALARRRTMALMSRRGPLLERSRLAVDLRDRGGDDARARAGARSVASLDARKDAARLRPPSAIARRIPARQRDAATRVDHTVPARHLLWRLLGHGRAHDARAPRFRAGANRPPGDPRRGGHTRVAGGGRWTDRRGAFPIVTAGVCLVLAAYVVFAFAPLWVGAVIAGAMLLEKTRDPLLLLQRLGPPVLEDLEEVVSRIELRAETSPGAALDAEIQLAQFVGRHAHGDHVADAHHDVVRNDLHPFGRKHFPEAGLVQMSVDLVDRLGLIVPEDDGDQHRLLRRCALDEAEDCCCREKQTDDCHATSSLS